MLRSKHFKTEQELLDWCNEMLHEEKIAPWNIKSVFRDVTNGDWVLFYYEN